MVGAAGFEPAVTAFRRRDVAQATPHPENGIGGGIRTHDL